MSLKKPPKLSRGRPREFDIDEALDRAIDVFWQNGYEGTSLPDLTEAMGINRPSLYAAFGNKEQLFRKALDRYTERATVMLRASLDQPTSRQSVEHVLEGVLDYFTRCKTTGGCFLVRSAIACSKTAAVVQKEVANRRKATERMLRERFERGLVEGDLPPGAKPADLASFFAIVIQGLAVQTCSGIDPAALRRGIKIAMKVWDC